MDHESGLISDHAVRIRTLEQGLSDLRNQVSSMETGMEVLREGVSNFRAFQGENREFIGWSKAREEERIRREIEDKEARDRKERADREDRDKKARLHYWWLGILSALIIASALGMWGGVKHFLATHHISSNTVSINQPTSQDARK